MIFVPGNHDEAVRQFFTGHWSWRAQARVIGCVMLFWIVEDFLWFALNPGYGLARFRADAIPWHKHWLGPMPLDYWIFVSLLLLLIWLSVEKRK